jgi:hypothetical protein
MQWLLSNIGISQNAALTPLLPVLQQPSTSVEFGNNQLGLGWFISPPGTNSSGSIWKDGHLDGFNSYIAFLPSTGGSPARRPSPGPPADKSAYPRVTGRRRRRVAVR